MYKRQNYTYNGKPYANAYDIMISASGNLNAPSAVRNLAYMLFVDRAQEDITAAGFRTYDFWQGTPGSASGLYESEPNTRKSQHSYALQGALDRKSVV